VDAETRYSDALGYGWASEGERAAEAIPLTPYLEVRAAAKNPTNLPHDVLYRDYIRGSGAQVFRVKMDSGAYRVHFLHPDRSESISELKAVGGLLNIVFPQDNWSVSGLVIQGPQSKLPLEPQQFPKAMPRPAITHQAPTAVKVGQPVSLQLDISPAAPATRIRLHYRPVNQQAKYKTIENEAGQRAFTIPGDDVSARWDLMYYFEILNRGGSGWFQPDPQTATPYYVVKVEP